VTRLAPGYGTHHFGETSVTLGAFGADAVLPDGTELEARPARTGAALMVAVRLGYDGNAASMTREWCYLHAKLCHAMGLPQSPALTAFARHGRVDTTGLEAAEEEMVAAAMKFLNLWRSKEPS
jgi:hypothetical protein